MHLAPDGALGREEQVLGHLLGERGAALHHVIGAGILHDGAERADHVHAEMIEEACILGCQHRLDHGGGNVRERNGVILADAATADDLTIGIGEGHGIVAAAVPDVARAGEGRKGIGEQHEADDHPEGGGIIEKIDHDAPQAAQPEAFQKAHIGGVAALEEIPALEHGAADGAIGAPQPAGQGVTGRKFGHARLKPLRRRCLGKDCDENAPPPAQGYSGARLGARDG